MTKSQKLQLRALTIRTLSPAQLAHVGGGGPATMNHSCSHGCSYSQYYCTASLDGCITTTQQCYE